MVTVADDEDTTAAEDTAETPVVTSTPSDDSVSYAPWYSSYGLPGSVLVIYYYYASYTYTTSSLYNSVDAGNAAVGGYEAGEAAES